MFKRTLLASSAIAALALPTTAMSAERIKIGVGGFMSQYFGYAESDVANSDGFDQQTDAEIHFTGETVLDNGLTIGVNVQLEAQQSGDQIDQQFAYIEGSFGAIYIGGEASAPALMSTNVPSAGIGLDSGDASNWIAGIDNNLITTHGTFTRDEDASEKLSYFTPRFQGFQLGVSYVPETAEDIDAAPNTNNGVRDNAFGVAANYDNSFGDFSIMASAAYMDYGDDDALAGAGDIENLGFGLVVGYGPFSVAAAYNDLDGSPVGGSIESFGFSGSYSSGPFGVSLAYITGEDKAAGTEADGFELGGSYALGPGVSAVGSIYYVDQENPAAVGDVEGFAIVGGLALAF